MSEVLVQWHNVVKNQDTSILKGLLHPDCIFYSPLLYKPQEGRVLTSMYLKAAARMFGKAEYFKYIKEVEQGRSAVLEFNARFEEIEVDGVDILTWDEHGKITEFKVMIRPFRAIEKVGEMMMSELQDISLKDKVGVQLDKTWRKFTK